MNSTNRYPMRRILISTLLLIALVSIFVVKLVDIQVVRAAELNESAATVRTDSRTVYGARGDIVDANGTVLADSVLRYDIALSPKQATVPRTADAPTLADDLAALGGALKIDPATLQQTIDAKLAANPESDFAYAAKLVDLETYERVQELGIPWVVPHKHPSRRYPNGSVAGNLIGFMSTDGKPLAGLELSHDECVAGKNGEVTYLPSLTDWIEIPGSTVVQSEARDGGTLELTIESDLQWEVQRIAEEQRLAVGAEWASIVVMEAKTGRLVTVADVPTIDPNVPTEANSEDRGSRSFTAPYEPGSTLKALTAASVLDAGEATPTSEIIAPYQYLPPNGADITDSDYHDDARLTLTGVLVDSSNTGISLFGERLSDQRRYDDFRDFGLGTKTEVGFPAEAPGNLHGEVSDWDNQTKYATMFGQGMTTTAVQIASLYQTIANDGVRMPVSLVESCTDATGHVTQESSGEGRSVVSKQAANETSAMLERVYTDGWLADEWNIPGYRVAAKTGTAQVADGEGGYLPGYLVSVAGFAPADDPEYVVSVSFMNPVKMNSSAASAPVFQQVMSLALKNSRTVPSGASAPELPATW